MKKEEIIPWDWQRILFGQTPAHFLIEVFLQSLLIYLILLIVLRLMGKRMDGQISLSEMGVVIMLGAIISVPVQLPDKGLLLGVVALLGVLGLQHLFNYITVINKEAEGLIEGTMSILVRDGVMDVDEMNKTGISRQQLLTVVRQHGISNLGNIKRVCFEACGILTVYEQGGQKAGLPAFPASERTLIGHGTTVVRGKKACAFCGTVVEANEGGRPCPHCGKKQWTEAVL